MLGTQPDERTKVAVLSESRVFGRDPGPAVEKSSVQVDLNGLAGVQRGDDRATQCSLEAGSLEVVAAERGIDGEVDGQVSQWPHAKAESSAAHERSRRRVAVFDQSESDTTQRREVALQGRVFPWLVIGRRGRHAFERWRSLCATLARWLRVPGGIWSAGRGGVGGGLLGRRWHLAKPTIGALLVRLGRLRARRERADRDAQLDGIAPSHPAPT